MPRAAHDIANVPRRVSRRETHRTPHRSSVITVTVRFDTHVLLANSSPFRRVTPLQLVACVVARAPAGRVSPLSSNDFPCAPLTLSLADRCRCPSLSPPVCTFDAVPPVQHLNEPVHMSCDMISTHHRCLRPRDAATLRFAYHCAVASGTSPSQRGASTYTLCGAILVRCRRHAAILSTCWPSSTCVRDACRQTLLVITLLRRVLLRAVHVVHTSRVTARVPAPFSLPHSARVCVMSPQHLNNKCFAWSLNPHPLWADSDVTHSRLLLRSHEY